ncbi:MAG: SusC/RagA family TonB-linked outer membrane protein [Prevotellaceae bacterium]|jgi:TonB-linked SusC/RagA family outer membrane protein|nr:SusC/RagA family TonB-linked outer membrane protein [Prevotellaceae bacterium]
MKKTVVLFACLLGLGWGPLWAQSGQQVSGVVTENGVAPLSGVSVSVKGATIAVLTDENGRYTINVPEKAMLIFSFMGMKTQEIEVGSRSIINVNMELDAVALTEVVVTGMTKVDKRLFTGAATSISASDAKLDGLAEVSRALEGRAAGVSVQNVSGTFGTAPKIRIRGATSIYGSSKPLWVVDGIVLEDVVEVDADALSSGDATTLISSAIAGLNAEDIESFQILKDGSATSIYGARAMAGVIVVTTKKGDKGLNRISYTGEFTYRMVPSYTNFNIMNSQDQMGVYQEMQKKGWLNLAEIANASESGVYGKMYELIYNGKMINLEVYRNAYLREAEYRNTNWFEQLFNHNIMHNHSVSITSGNDKASFYASLSALVDEGWTKSSQVNRYTANLNTTYNLLPNVSINLISNTAYRRQKAPGTLARSVDVVSGTVKRDFDINPYSYALNTSRTLDPNIYYKRNYADFNILHELDNNYMDLNVLDTKFQGELKWKIIPGLEVAALGAVKYQASSQEHSITDFSNQALAYRAMPTTVIRDSNPFLYRNPDDVYAVPITVLPQGGIYNRTDYSMLSWDFRAAITYDKVFDDTHIINLYGATEINSVDRHLSWFRGWGMQYSMGEIPFYAYEVFKKGKEEGSDYYYLGNTHSRHAAFIGNATYSYKRRYTVNGTLRYEGSNKLGRSTSSRWLPTWNVSGAWNAHEESFFNNVFDPILSHLTLRASYSLTADRGPASVTNSRVVIGSYNPWRPTSGVTESGLTIVDPENSALTYEKKHEINIGTNLGFLDNRINLEFDWYRRDNYDLIAPVTTQGIGGAILKMGNIATMKSSGIEITLSTKNIQTEDFSWTTDFIYAHINNEVTKLENIQRVIDMVSGTGFTLEGYPVRSIFSIPFVGLNEDGIPMFINQDGEITSTGIYFQESDKIDFLKYSGSADPTDMGSLGNILKYKNWRLNVFITYSMGNVVRLDPVFSNSYSDLTAMPKEFRNRWVVPGDENITDIPVIASVRKSQQNYQLAYAYSAYNYSTARIASGDFIRMKEISIAYDFPEKMVRQWRLSNLSLKLQATNLFLIYADRKLNGQDPEFFNTGGVAAPVPKQFTLTLRVGF